MVKEATRLLRTKGNCSFRFGMNQNTSDLKATFREKRKEYQGYITNIEETMDKNDFIITDYQFKQSTYNDSKLIKIARIVREKAAQIPVITDETYCMDINIGGEGNLNSFLLIWLFVYGIIL